MGSHSVEWDDLEASQEQALLGWLEKRWNAERGAGVKAKIAGVDLRIGHGGQWRLKNAGVGMALLWATDAAIKHASGGASSLPLSVGILAFPLYASVAPAAEGAAATWSKARQEGCGPCQAFGALCKRYALKFAGLTAPIMLVALPAAITLPGALGMGWGAKGLAKMGLGKASASLAAGSIRMGLSVKKTFEQLQAARRWRVGLLVQVARMDGASDLQATEIYSTLAKMRMGARWRTLSKLEAKDFSISTGEDSKAWAERLMEGRPRETELRQRFEALTRQADFEEGDLRLTLDQMEAAGVPPWFKPEPGMPSLGALARAVGEWDRSWHGEGILPRLEALSAHEEGHAIAGAVGVLSGNQAAPAPRRRL